MRSIAFMSICYGLMWFFIGAAMIGTQDHKPVLSVLFSVVAMIFLVISVYYAADFLTHYWEIDIHKAMDQPVPVYEIKPS